MYSIVAEIIDHSWTQGDSSQQYIYYICGVVIVMLTVVVIDMIYRTFSHFWRS